MTEENTSIVQNAVEQTQAVIMPFFYQLVGFALILAIIALLFLFLKFLIIKNIKKTKSKIEIENKKDYEEMPYKLVESIFTKSEKEIFDILEPLSKDKNLILFSKVRMADIAKIENKSNNFQYWFNKISSKHIDFLLCKSEDGKPILGIELDDYTHNQKSRKERDKFVNQVYKSIGLPILHITEINKEKIDKEITQFI